MAYDRPRMDDRREMLADLMEHILTVEDDGWTSTYVDAECGIIDVRIEMRPEWTAAVNATRARPHAAAP